MSSKKALSRVFGLVKDVVTLSAATVGAGLRVTGEAADNARPHVRGATEKLRSLTISREESRNGQRDEEE